MSAAAVNHPTYYSNGNNYMMSSTHRTLEPLASLCKYNILLNDIL